jgi:hypothetical protein
MKFIIYDPKTQLHKILINSFIFECQTRNIDTVYYDRNLLDLNYQKDDYQKDNYQKDVILIILNPQFLKDVEVKITLDNISEKFKYKILYITEPINLILEKKVYINMINTIKPFCLWTYTYENFNKINVPINIYKIYPFVNKSLHYCKIDIKRLQKRDKSSIVFIGNINENRKSICTQFGDTLINYIDTWDLKPVFKKHLFYLNIHRRLNCKCLETLRVIPILANGGFVISERVNEEEEKLFEKYNIVFVERNEIYNTFKKINETVNINYEDIYIKTLLFRNAYLNHNFDKFLDFFSKLII